MSMAMRKWLYSVVVCAVVFVTLWVTRCGSGAKTKVNRIDGAEMVKIPAGTFMMGRDWSPRDPLPGDRLEDRPSDAPKHRVQLSSFWIYKYEVTVGQYRKFCKATGHAAPADEQWDKWPENYPVVKVSWRDAKDYADWAQASLPTEAQWEYAACGGSARLYPWGNEWKGNECSHWAGVQAGSCASVGSHPQDVSPFGVYDMAGNVAECCSDYYDDDYYASSPERNPQGPAERPYRVKRGACWKEDMPDDFYITNRRTLADIINDAPDLGFRCAR